MVCCLFWADSSAVAVCLLSFFFAAQFEYIILCPTRRNLLDWNPRTIKVKSKLEGESINAIFETSHFLSIPTHSLSVSSHQAASFIYHFSAFFSSGLVNIFFKSLSKSERNDLFLISKHLQSQFLIYNVWEFWKSTFFGARRKLNSKRHFQNLETRDWEIFACWSFTLWFTTENLERFSLAHWSRLYSLNIQTLVSYLGEKRFVLCCAM